MEKIGSKVGEKEIGTNMVRGAGDARARPTEKSILYRGPADNAAVTLGAVTVL